MRSLDPRPYAPPYAKQRREHGGLHVFARDAGPGRLGTLKRDGALSLEFSESALEDLADRIAPLVATRVAQALEASEVRDGYLAPEGAASYLGVSKRRVYDLTSARAIKPDGRDGRTPLFSRATLDAYVRANDG